MDTTRLREVPLFSGLSDAALSRVAELDVHEVPDGQLLADAGSGAEGMFVVLDGEVVVERGDLHVEMGAGSFFGELPLLVPDAHRVARVRALSHAHVVAVPRMVFDDLLETEPSFSRALVTELAARLVAARTGH